MTTLFFDTKHSDHERRQRLYDGDLYLYGPTANTLAFCDFAREMIADAFSGRDPEVAQHDMQVEEYAETLGKLKPAFIHHSESKKHLQAILEDAGVDVGATYFEVPKMRSSTSDGYLTAGIAYAWHPHRDTWYSAPQCQINWWIPIYDITRENTMTFFPRYFDRQVPNNSEGYNYYEWNQKYRGTSVTQYLNHDPRPLPRPTEDIDTTDEIRVVCPVGGMLLFSGAQLHASVENTSGKTRFSVDFRTAHIDDLIPGRGAPNVDSKCTGTVLNEFNLAADLSDMPREIIAQFEDGTETLGPAVFEAP